MPPTTSRRLIGNTILNLLNQALYAVVGFAMVGFFLAEIGEDGYGLWVLIASIFSYRTLLSSGLNSAVNREVPVLLAKGDTDGLNQVASTAFAYFLLPACVILVATGVIYLNVGDWFAVPDSLVREAALLVVLVGVSVGISLPFQVYTAILSGYQRYDLINLSSIVALVLRTGFTVYLLTSGYGLLTMAIVYGLAEFGMRLWNLASARHLMRSLSISARHVDLHRLGTMFGYGLSTMLYMSTSALSFKTGELVLGSMDSTAAVSRFHIASTPVMILIMLIQVSGAALKPAVSDLDARREDDRIHQLLLVTQKYNLIVIFAATSFLLIMGRHLFTIWVGARYSDGSVIDELTVILQALSIAAACRLTQHSSFIVLMGKGQHRFFGRLGFITVLTVPLLCVGVLSLHGGGTATVAWSVAAPLILMSLIVVPIHVHRRIELGVLETIRESWLPAILAAAPGCAAMLLFERLLPPSNWLVLMIAVAVAGTTTLVSAWLVALSPPERSRFIAMVRR